MPAQNAPKGERKFKKHQVQTLKQMEKSTREETLTDTVLAGQCPHPPQNETKFSHLQFRPFSISHNTFLSFKRKL